MALDTVSDLRSLETRLRALEGVLTVTPGGATLRVGGNLTIEAGGSLNIVVGGQCRVTVGSQCTIRAGSGMTIVSDSATSIRASSDMTIVAGSQSTLEAGSNIAVTAGSQLNIQAGNSVGVKSGKNTSIEAGFDALVKGGRKVAIESKGPAELTSQKLAIQAGDELAAEARNLLLKAGASRVQLKQDGSIAARRQGHEHQGVRRHHHEGLEDQAELRRGPSWTGSRADHTWRAWTSRSPAPHPSAFRRRSAAGSQRAAGRRGRISSSCSPGPRPGASVLLIAPTGAGKTLAGFLPSLTDLARRGPARARAADLRAAHALRLAAQGARRRHPAQSGKADRRDGPAHPARDAHRRHAGLQAAAPETRPAGHAADDARAGGAARGGAEMRGASSRACGR